MRYRLLGRSGLRVSELCLGSMMFGGGGPDRDRWVLGTKYGLSSDHDDPNAGGAHRKNLRRSLEASPERLGTDYVDILWLHIWDAFTPIEEVIAALDDLVRSGKVLYVGISDTAAWMVSRAVTLAEERGLTAFSAMAIADTLNEVADGRGATATRRRSPGYALNSSAP